MSELRFDENLCLSCTTSDCLEKCKFVKLGGVKGNKEMLKIAQNEDSIVLRDCITCYSCEEYCEKGNHPFYLISEKREQKGLDIAPRPILKQWINLGEPVGRYKVGKINERVLSFGFVPEFLEWVGGKLFEDVMPSYVFGQEFFCNVAYLHFGRTSIIKERMPLVMNNFRKLGIKEVICLHDECYGAFTSLAPAFGIEVPFKPIHYYEYLLERLRHLKEDIRPLNVKVAYQRPCSSRLSPSMHPLVKDIFNRIGAELLDREYQDEKALCCGEVIRLHGHYDLAEELQRRNIEDIVMSGAEYCVFNCPYCYVALGHKLVKKGVKPIHIIELCRMALGEEV